MVFFRVEVGPGEFTQWLGFCLQEQVDLKYSYIMHCPTRNKDNSKDSKPLHTETQREV